MDLAGVVIEKTVIVVSPSDIARHKTANAKGDRGITSKEYEFLFSTTQRLIPLETRKFLSVSK